MMYETQFRHLCRDLLRQCSYLPDNAARSYLHHYVVMRFRKYLPRRASIPDVNSLKRKALFETAQKGLMSLKYANEGYADHLYKVLAMTYGRTGKRKHQLLDDVRKQRNPDDSKMTRPDTTSDDRAVLDTQKPPSNGDLTSEQSLQALIESQYAKDLKNSGKPSINRVKPFIPQHNIWGRPTPLKRVRNLKAKWYAETLDRVLPPLPETEWNRLGNLAIGRTPWPGPVPRRVGSSSNRRITVSNTYPTSVKNSSQQYQAKILRKERQKENPHKLTHRFMRSLWTKIFSQCPTMKWDQDFKKWIVKWGNVHEYQDIDCRSTSQLGLDFFGDANEQSGTK